MFAAESQCGKLFGDGKGLWGDLYREKKSQEREKSRPARIFPGALGGFGHINYLSVIAGGLQLGKNDGFSGGGEGNRGHTQKRVCRTIPGGGANHPPAEGAAKL